jgi:hypothetical protein
MTLDLDAVNDAQAALAKTKKPAPKVVLSPAAQLSATNPHANVVKAAIEGGSTDVLHLRVPAGEALAMIGANGSGEHWREVLTATADAYLQSIFQRMTLEGQALSPIEEILLTEIAVLHARAIDLNRRAVTQQNPRWAAMFHEAADRSSNQVRRAIETLQNIRAPRQTQFIRAAQVNQAAGPQQVVNGASGPSQISGNQKTTNELEKEHAAKALPAITDGASGSLSSGAGNGAAASAVAMVDRADNGRRKATKRAKRTPARSKKPGVRRVTKRNQTARGRAAGD